MSEAILNALFERIERTAEEQRRITLEILEEIKRTPAWQRDIERRLDELDARVRKLESGK